MEPLPWPNSHVAKRHQAERVSGGVIDDADQFNNGVMGADRRFGVVRRNEVFATAEVEGSHTRGGHCVDRIILRRRETRRRPHGEVRVENVAAESSSLEVDLHTGRRVQDLGLANAPDASGSGRSGFRAQADNEFGRGSRTKRHTIAEGGTGCLIGPQVANPDVNIIVGTGAQGGLCTGSAQGDCIDAVAIVDDTVLSVVLDGIVTRAALDREPGVRDRDVDVEVPAIFEDTSTARVCGTSKNRQPAGRRRCNNLAKAPIFLGDIKGTG